MIDDYAYDARLEAMTEPLRYRLPIPRRWHRCTVAYGAYDDGHRIDRCGCGAIRVDRGPWQERNSRRRVR